MYLTPVKIIIDISAKKIQQISMMNFWDLKRSISVMLENRKNDEYNRKLFNAYCDELIERVDLEGFHWYFNDIIPPLYVKSWLDNHKMPKCKNIDEYYTVTIKDLNKYIGDIRK